MINFLNNLESIYKKRISKIVLEKIRGFHSIEGWLTENEAIGLFSVSKRLKSNPSIVEIGSWKGKSTYCIAKGLKNGVIHCIDPFNADGEEGSKEVYENTRGEINLIDSFKNNMSTLSTNVKLKIHQGYSKEFIDTILNIDFLFIDGDHSIAGCRYDFENYSKDLKVGGYLAFHDYYKERPDLGPTWVIDNLVKTNSSFLDYSTFDSLRVFKKVKQDRFN